MTLDITTVRAGDTVTVSLRGELDLATKPDLVASLDALAAEDVHQVVVDLAQLEFLDSSGITALIVHATKSRERGGWLRITNASRMPRRALEITGVYELLSGNEDATGD